MMANQEPEGVFQVDMNSKEISHRQIPLGLPGQDGGGSHGAQWHNGKLWIVANRPRLLLRVDPKTWAPEVAIPIYAPADKPRWHDMTFDAEGNIWQVTGNDSKSYKEGQPGLVKYHGKTGAVMATYDFVPGSCDPHGLEFHDGMLISCDAGIHPGWPNGDSPTAWLDLQDRNGQRSRLKEGTCKSKRRNFLVAAAAAPAAAAMPAVAQPAHPACLPAMVFDPTRPANKIEVLYKTKHGQPNGLALTRQSRARCGWWTKEPSIGSH